MHGTDFRWCTFCTPNRFGQLLGLSLLILQKVGDRRRVLLHLLGVVKQVHLVILVAHFIRQTACPSLDLVELMPFLVVTSLANIHFDVWWQTAWSALEVPCGEHDETPPLHFFNRVVPIPPSFDNLVSKKMFVEPMYGLLGSVVPADIDHRLSVRAAVCTVDLSWDRLGEIIWILNVNPVANFVELAVV